MDLNDSKTFKGCPRMEKEKAKPVGKYMTQEEVETFFSKIKNKRDKALFATIYHYRLRVTEATLLNLDDLDLNRNKIPDFYSLIVSSDSFLLNLSIRSSICFSFKSSLFLEERKRREQKIKTFETFLRNKNEELKQTKGTRKYDSTRRAFEKELARLKIKKFFSELKLRTFGKRCTNRLRQTRNQTLDIHEYLKIAFCIVDQISHVCAQ
jgi:hypothetical protein